MRFAPARLVRDGEISATAARVAWVSLLVTIVAVFWFLLDRNLGLNPVLFADEWYYSKMSRLQPLADAILPSWLYFWIFRATNACGDGFLDCVRTGNALFWVASAPFLYAICRRVAGRALACLAVLLSLLAPLNLYTAMFMPESTYYFGFCVLSWLALNRTGWARHLHGLALGIVLGLMSLVKVHALFLLPALAVYLLYLGRLRAGPNWLRDGVLSAVIAVAATFAVKFGLGYVLAGQAGLTLFGSFYGSTSGRSHSLVTLVGPALISARGHLEVLAVLLGFPLALILYTLPSRQARAEAGEATVTLQFYTLLTLGAAAGMAVVYTASIASFGPIEAIRLHVRYYSFVFPLLFIVGISAFGKTGGSGLLRWRAAVALLLAGTVLLGLLKLPHYSLSMVDGPDIAGLPLDQLRGQLLVGADLLVLLLWACRSKFAAPLFALVALPWFLVNTNLANHNYLAQLIPSWEADRAGKAAHRYVPAAERKLITVAGLDPQEIMRAQFHIDDKDTSMLELPKGQPILPYQIPPHGKWLLVVGDHALPAGMQAEIATKDYQLVRLDTHRRVLARAILSEPFGKGLIAAAEGMSGAESWGRWSDRKQAVLHFAEPLPRRVFLILKAMAYGENATQPFTLHLGGTTTSFMLGQAPQEVGLWLATDGKQRTLTIDVPHPAAPTPDGVPGGDHRLLGIGIYEIEIATVDDAAPANG
jgi:phosphoglycerol transferase